jgi:ribonuclease III
LAPADKRLYSIRDVTATVESIPLICSSILSKKLASGTNVLAMNVTTGGGAFMAKLEDAKVLAQTITSVAQGAGVRCHSLVTDMDQPLGSAAGNAIEVQYALDYLNGIREPRMHEVVLALGALVLIDAGLAKDNADAKQKIEASLTSGAALEKFALMISALGGPTDFCENSTKYLVAAPVIREIMAECSGWIESVGAKEIGMSVVVLGGCDAVFDLAVAHLLLDHHPEAREGELSKMRAALVNTSSLAEIARELELGKFIRLSRGELASGGSDRASILADVLEAVVGALYREGGYEVARACVERLLGTRLVNVNPRDPKTELQEALHASGSEAPVYRLECVEGPEHQPIFVSIVEVDGQVVGRGRGATKKASQQNAAEEALAHLKGGDDLDARFLTKPTSENQDTAQAPECVKESVTESSE